MRTDMLRFDGAVERDPAIHKWMKQQDGDLGAIAREWFAVMRNCGDEVRELMHDGYATACLGDVPFAYVGVFRSHVNVGFFQGAALPDPAGLLQGSGRFMRHVKLRPGKTPRPEAMPAGRQDRGYTLSTPANDAALRTLIEAAYADIKSRVENG